MTQQEIDLQMEVLRSTTQRLLKEGPEACRKYLEDAGILPKKEEVVPPGIVQFKSQTGSIYEHAGSWSYEEFVNWNLGYKHTVEKISVENVIWTVGEKVGYNDTMSNAPFVITGFKYELGEWYAVNDGWFSISIRKLAKLPTRPVVCTLQGKDMHEGDTMWIVDHFWNVCVTTIVPEPAVNYKNRFKSRELANDFVRENKPVYPAAEFDKLKNALEKIKDYDFNPMEPLTSAMECNYFRQIATEALTT